MPLGVGLVADGTVVRDRLAAGGFRDLRDDHAVRHRWCRRPCRPGRRPSRSPPPPRLPRPRAARWVRPKPPPAPVTNATPCHPTCPWNRLPVRFEKGAQCIARLCKGKPRATRGQYVGSRSRAESEQPVSVGNDFAAGHHSGGAGSRVTGGADVRLRVARISTSSRREQQRGTPPARRTTRGAAARRARRRGAASTPAAARVSRRLPVEPWAYQAIMPVSRTAARRVSQGEAHMLGKRQPRS